MRKAKILALLVALFITGIVISIINKSNEDTGPPNPIPEGILVKEIPEKADIIFVSIRYVVNEVECLDSNYDVKKSFLNDADCIQKIYDPETDSLASPRQLYTMDIESGEITQLTNVDYDFSSSKKVNSNMIMAIGKPFTLGEMSSGEPDIYLINLEQESIECLTCKLKITSINNPDYSPVNNKILFSAQRKGVFHNYLFTLDLDGNLEQLTRDEDYMDFDCSWSEDGEKIVYSRLPVQEYPWRVPSQVWLMDLDGGNKSQLTQGGPNPDNEPPHGVYPIGIDADPDLSPDNRKIVFSRLKTGKKNKPFGVYELVVLDVLNGEEMILDSSYANMIPEWKQDGIVFIRQIGSTSHIMERKQAIYIYRDNEFTSLETYPYDVFPIGSNAASWLR